MAAFSLRIRIHTLSNPCLLHYRRLLCTFNSSGGAGDDPNSPDSNQTPLRNQWSASQLQEKLKHITLMRNHWASQLHKNWKQFDFSSSEDILKARYLDPDLQFLSEFNASRNVLYHRILAKAAKFRRIVEDMDWRTFNPMKTRIMLWNRATVLIVRIKDLDEITYEGAKWLAKLSNARVASFDEMITNLSQMRKEWFVLKDLNSLLEDLRKLKWDCNKEEQEELNEDLWDELNEELGNVRWDEIHQALMSFRGACLFDAKQLAMKTDEYLACLEENMKFIREMRQPIIPD
ncbi:uncharacterized protein LOC130745338 [Lotus japonicus]|uniref:uncharacterized protein LOC130745338 n=1 Tax=Lotus japonicus TaxID=34305 RepID=UPI0025864EB5|nr:uncharacterized protein LOC130745338 [Lotus japonicus]XP_057453506.1 uncharacterized protein LOC130745338 [Lotus japonicus]